MGKKWPVRRKLSSRGGASATRPVIVVTCGNIRCDKSPTPQGWPAHRAYLTSLLEKDQLFAAGPFEDGYGALIIYEADSPAAVEALMAADPFHAAGVFVRWTVRPWKTVFLNPRLMPQS